jgi:signal transduction histidine kinase
MAEPAISLFVVLQVILLALSFGFLFQFGVETVRDRWPRLTAVPLLVTLAWSLWFLLPGLALGPDLEAWHRQASIWARYLIGFPGGIVAAYGLRHQAQRRIRPLDLPHIYNTLRAAGLGLGAYAILGGLVVPPGSFFPANWINTQRLLNVLGLPVEALRSVVGLFLAVAIIRALEVFEVEVDRVIEQMEAERSRTTEREQIGRELHDGAIQTVFTAGLLVESARGRLETDDETAQLLDRAMTVLNEAIASLRAYIGELRPGPLDVTLADGLREATSDPGLGSLVSVNLDLAFPEEESPTPARTAHVLAVLGEALSNAARHANARQVTVRAERREEMLELVVEDDGRGFPEHPRGDGYGLRNMRDRARLLGGHLTIDSEPGQGTRVTLVAPWEEER